MGGRNQEREFSPIVATLDIWAWFERGLKVFANTTHVSYGWNIAEGSGLYTVERLIWTKVE